MVIIIIISLRKCLSGLLRSLLCKGKEKPERVLNCSAQNDTWALFPVGSPGLLVKTGLRVGSKGSKMVGKRGYDRK